MNIVYIITGLGMGGAEKQLCLLADQVVNKGEEVTVVSLVGETINRPFSKDIKIIEFNMSKNILGLIKGIIKLAQLFLKTKPQIIHSHMFHANMVARIACLLTNNTKRLICTAHNKNEGGSIRMLCYRFSDCLCWKTTNVSQEALDHFIKIGAFKKKKSELVYNGIDFNKFKFSKTNRDELRNEFSINQDDVLILSVGRLTEAKDYPNLLHAFSKVHGPNIKLLIVGDGELRIQLLDLVFKLDLVKRVIFAGIRQDVHKFYSAADLFVLASRWEGFGLVVAEAMGTHCPVVATDAGGVSEVVGSQKFIVPVNNIDALACKIKEILSLSENGRKAIAQENFKHVTEIFSIEKIISKWLCIYNCREEKK